MFADLEPAVADSQIYGLMAVSRGVCIVKANASYVTQLWWSDGTSAGGLTVFTIDASEINSLQGRAFLGITDRTAAGIKLPSRVLSFLSRVESPVAIFAYRQLSVEGYGSSSQALISIDRQGVATEWFVGNSTDVSVSRPQQSSDRWFFNTRNGATRVRFCIKRMGR